MVFGGGCFCIFHSPTCCRNKALRLGQGSLEIALGQFVLRESQSGLQSVSFLFFRERIAGLDIALL